MRFFKFLVLLSVILWIFSNPRFVYPQALKNPNYVGGVQEAGRPVYPYTHAWFVSLNDSIQYPCGFNGTPTEQWGYTFFALPTGGDVDATCYQQPFNITADIFSPVSKPILIWLPDVAITLTANVTVPSNFMLCYGPGSSFTAGVGYTLVNNAQPCNGSGGGKGQPVNWYTNGTLVGTEPGGDFDNGSSIAITGVDDPTNKEVHITVNASGMGCPTSSGVVPDSTICAGPASSGELSPSVIQTQMIVQPANTQSLTFGLPVKTGDDILVVVTCGANQTGSGCGSASGDTPVFSDSQANSYSLQGSTGSTIPFGYKGAWVAKAITSAPGALTVTVTNNYTYGYDAVAIIDATNIGIFEGSAANDTGAPSAILVTASYTTLNSGDFLLSIGGGDTNNAAMVLYQNSADWLGIAAPQTFSIGTDVIWYGLAATQQGPTATRSVSWSSYPPGPWVGSEVNTLIMAFEPATYPPPGSGPPSFRYQQPPDLPSIVDPLKLGVVAQTYYGLPLCAAGTEGYIGAVEDATVNTSGATVNAGGGTYHVEVYCDGTYWRVAGTAATSTANIHGDGVLYAATPNVNLPNFPALIPQPTAEVLRTASNPVDFQVVQSNTVQCTTCPSNTSISFLTNPTGGQMGILIAAGHYTGGNSLTDSAGDTWTNIYDAYYDVSAFVDCNLSAAAHTLTFPSGFFDAHNGVQLYLEEVQGNPTSSCFDQKGAAYFSTSNPLTVTTAGSVAQATEYVLGVFSAYPGDAATCPYGLLAPGSGYETVINNCNAPSGGYNGEQLFVERYLTDSGLSGAQTATAQNLTPGSFSSIVLTFKLSTLATSAPPFMGMIPNSFIFRTDASAPFLGPYKTTAIGGSSVAAGACTTGTVSIANAITGMIPMVAPETYPGDYFEWSGYVSAAGTVTVRVCNRSLLSETPTSSLYDVSVGNP